MTTRREFVKALGLAPMLCPRRRSRRRASCTTIYLEHVIRPDHVESPERLRKILAEMRRQRLDQEVVRIPHFEAPLPYIEGHHTKEQVASVRKMPTSGAAAEAAVGGALAAVKAVSSGDARSAFCAIRPPGHHANNTGEVEGFCLYSNAAIVAEYFWPPGSPP